MDVLQKLLAIRYDEIVYNCNNGRQFTVFQSNFHFVRRDKFWGMISIDGTEIIPLAYCNIKFIDNDFIVVWENAWLGKRGYVAKITHGVFDFEETSTIYIEDEWSRTSMCGLYDKTGEKWLDAVFNSIIKLNDFFIAEKYEKSSVPSRHFFLRKKTEDQLREFYVFKSEILRKDPAKRNDLELYSADYSYQYFQDINIYETYCAVMDSNFQWGFTDKEFNELFPCIIDELLKYKDGKRKVRINGEQYLLDTESWILTNLFGGVVTDYDEITKSNMPF